MLISHLEAHTENIAFSNFNMNAALLYESDASNRHVEWVH